MTNITLSVSSTRDGRVLTMAHGGVSQLEANSDVLTLTRRPLALRVLLWMFILFCTSVLIVVRTQPAMASTKGNAAAVSAQRHDGQPVHEDDHHGSGGGDGNQSGDRISNVDLHVTSSSRQMM